MTQSRYEAIFLVDGYNIIGAWSELQQALRDEGMESARRQLIETLTNYSAYKGFDTRLIFDAQYRESQGTLETITPNLAIHYTNFGQTADSHIEKLCAAFRNDLRKFEQRLIVATSDQAQRLTVQGYGAEWISAQRLAAEVALTVRQVKHRQRPSSRSRKRSFVSSLDSDALQRLTDLRMGKT